MVDDDFVEAEVGGENIFAGFVEIDGVAVRLFLAALVYAGAFVLDEGARGFEAAIFIDRQGRDGTAAIVGDHNMFAF